MSHRVCAFLRNISTPTHNTYQKSRRKKSKVYRSKKEESKRSYLSTQSLPSLQSTHPLLLYSDWPIYHHSRPKKPIGNHGLLSRSKNSLDIEKERKIEVERQREFQIPELSSLLALYLYLLFLFFFIWFSHFSQTNRFGFTKRQNRGTHQNCIVDEQWKTLDAQWQNTIGALAPLYIYIYIYIRNYYYIVVLNYFS